MTTQDGYDWPNNVADERWPADTFQPATPYWREQLAYWREQFDLRERQQHRAELTAATRRRLAERTGR